MTIPASGPDSSAEEVPAPPLMISASGSAPPALAQSTRDGVDDIVIGAGVVSSGQFVTRGLICIDGKLRDSDLLADVISISHGAEFEGKAQARQVEVFGRISGELVATEQLVLRASAHVTGRIASPCMVMHRGATVVGEVETIGFDVECGGRVGATGAAQRDPVAVK